MVEPISELEAEQEILRLINENDGSGSVTPTSVPASLEVKPITKWYIVSSLSRIETGGRTPNASAVNNTMVSGCGPDAPLRTLGFAVSG